MPQKYAIQDPRIKATTPANPLWLSCLFLTAWTPFSCFSCCSPTTAPLYILRLFVHCKLLGFLTAGSNERNAEKDCGVTMGIESQDPIQRDDDKVMGIPRSDPDRKQ